MQYLRFYNLLTINTLQRHKNIINQTQKNRTILLCYVSRNRLFRERANIIITFHKMEKGNITKSNIHFTIRHKSIKNAKNNL